MKALLAALPLVFLSAAAVVADDTPAPAQKTHRYIIERTFPRGALDSLDAATKAKVNANNASVGVRWLHSYSNADKTRTYCVYERPSETAIRKAAELNALPVDSVLEVPVDLQPGEQVKAAKK